MKNKITGILTLSVILAFLIGCQKRRYIGMADTVACYGAERSLYRGEVKDLKISENGKVLEFKDYYTGKKLKFVNSNCRVEYEATRVYEI